MDNDTPGENVDESHAPLMSERNENDAAGVGTGMDNTPPPAIDDETVTPVPAVEPGPITPAIPVEAVDLEPGVQTAEFAYDEILPSPPPPPPPPPPPHDFYGLPPQPATQADAAPAPAPAPAKRSGVLYILGVVAAGALGAALTIGALAVAGTFDDEVPVVTTTVAAAAPAESTSTPPLAPVAGTTVDPSAVAAKVLPGIVTVIVYEDAEATIASGSGSGVVMSEDGFIITNHHVIEGALSYEVTFEDGRIYTAELIGSDDLTDIAVLKISADNLTAVEFGSADSLRLGDPSIAIGNPLGQEGGASITAGIISAFNRRVDFADETSLFGMIQTDAAINSGSSGGALVNANGELIGITSAIGVSTAGPEGIGYAIPIEVVDRITSEIIETGDVVHPFIGVRMQSYFGQAEDGAVIPGGAMIVLIEDESGAGDAGMLQDDVVIAIDGKKVTGQSDLALAVRLFRVGDVVTFTVIRDGETLNFDVLMGQRPPEFQG
jgi:S1-C subfamily serine protease